MLLKTKFPVVEHDQRAPINTISICHEVLRSTVRSKNWSKKIKRAALQFFRKKAFTEFDLNLIWGFYSGEIAMAELFKIKEFKVLLAKQKR